MAAQLPLRDVHLPAAPSWWPLAPGWWCVLAALVLVCVLGFWWQHRKRKARRHWLGLFDQAVEDASTPAARVAAASEMLRRAAPAAARALTGKEWLAFLDAGRAKGFVDGDGQLLLDGGFRRDVNAEQAQQACALARLRYLELQKEPR